MTTYYNHFLQSKNWGEFKTKYGTTAVEAGGVQYTKHKIPFTAFYVGYAPKVHPDKIDFSALRKSAKEQNCAYINLDCPAVIKGAKNQAEIENLLAKHATKAKKTTFAEANVLLDLTKSEQELLAGMHHKKRYNIKKAEGGGLVVHCIGDNKLEEQANQQHKTDDQANKTDAKLTSEALSIFYKLHKETAERQGFYIKPIEYYQLMWDLFSNQGVAKLLIAEYKGEPVASWMLFMYENVLYYPYGGSSSKHQNLFPNELICWNAIKLGKAFGCHTFDMWGASVNPEDKTDDWYGFTNFKLGFGGTHVVYINSYDLIVNQAMYHSFSIVNDIRWRLLKSVRG